MKTKDTVGERTKAKEAAITRVAVYCHACENKDGKELQYDQPGKAYVEMVNKSPAWILAGIYAENPAFSKKSKRPQFLRLMEDCENGLVDCVLCRSISVFIRNERKDVSYIRRLQELGIRLIFVGDEMESDSDYFELVLTVLEAFAEAKSRAFSEAFAIKKRELAFEGATPFIRLYGYRCSDKGIEVFPEEANIVRQVFDYYEHGVYAYQIAEILSEKGIPTPRGPNNRWNDATIREMIINEKYVGDYDALRITMAKQRRAGGKGGGKNRIKSTVYHKDHHPAIISREQFERCNMITCLRSINTPLQYPFGKYLRCPYCGHVLYRRRAPSWHQSCYCCEGGGACRKFVIIGAPVEQAVLSAYKDINMKALQKKAGMRDYKTALAATQMLRIKQEHPAFDKIDYWWLDELVERIDFGLHSHTASELKAIGDMDSIMDDRTISILWRCGLVSTVSSGVKTTRDDPRRRAREWDALILSRPEQYPELVQEIKRTKR